MKNVTKKWLELADYDLESAKIMLASGRYLYVAFMCQQAIEKQLKAYLSEKTDETPAYTHNLTVLIELAQINFTEEELGFISLLNRYYINARYPTVKEKLSQSLNKKTGTELYLKTKEVLKCLKKELQTLKKF